MSVGEYQQQNLSSPTSEGPGSSVDELQRQSFPVNLSPNLTDFEKFTEYEFIDSRELARRLTVPPSWIRDQVRARSEDPLPHVNLGKYVRFLWGSPALELWIRRRIVVGNNRRLGRTRRKEQE
jgi:hypothetical protein